MASLVTSGTEAFQASIALAFPEHTIYGTCMVGIQGRHLRFERLHSVCLAREFDYERLAKEILKRDNKSISMNNGNTEWCMSSAVSLHN